MFLSGQVTHAITLLIGNLLAVKPVSGGSINKCYQVTTNTGIYFLKTNSAEQFPGLFVCEAEGLKRIRDTRAIAVPRVTGYGKAGQEIFLILNWIEDDPRNSGLYRMGKQLAQLHKHGAENFGLDHDNYMGSLPQKNQWHSTWHEFFTNERIEPQLEISYNRNLIDKQIKNNIELLLTKLQTLYPVELPALVHGDLWNGNYLNGTNGPALIDPAVYYGNREVDLAMSALFGGFSPDFYTGYNDEFPLQKGWQERLDIWNLYPLLVHLNLFGEGYLAQIKGILKKFA